MLSTGALLCRLLCSLAQPSPCWVQVLSAKASTASSPAPSLQQAPRAAASGPSASPPGKPSNISNALDGIAELQQVPSCLAWPRHRSQLARLLYTAYTAAYMSLM